VLAPARQRSRMVEVRRASRASAYRGARRRRKCCRRDHGRVCRTLRIAVEDGFRPRRKERIFPLHALAAAMPQERVVAAGCGVIPTLPTTSCGILKQYDIEKAVYKGTIAEGVAEQVPDCNHGGTHPDRCRKTCREERCRLSRPMTHLARHGIMLPLPVEENKRRSVENAGRRRRRSSISIEGVWRASPMPRTAQGGGQTLAICIWRARAISDVTRQRAVGVGWRAVDCGGRPAPMNAERIGARYQCELESSRRQLSGRRSAATGRDSAVGFG